MCACAGVAEDEAEKTLECALTMFRLLQVLPWRIVH
jgi:hypothetical protein